MKLSHLMLFLSFIFAGLVFMSVSSANDMTTKEISEAMVETHINAYQRGVRNTLKHVDYPTWLDHFEKHMTDRVGDEQTFPVRLKDDTIVIVSMRR